MKYEAINISKPLPPPPPEWRHVLTLTDREYLALRHALAVYEGRKYASSDARAGVAALWDAIQDVPYPKDMKGWNG